MKAIAGVLAEGDFYGDADRSEHDWDPAGDLQMQAFVQIRQRIGRRRGA
jgi:hypothetical protein